MKKMPIKKEIGFNLIVKSVLITFVLKDGLREKRRPLSTKVANVLDVDIATIMELCNFTIETLLKKNAIGQDCG